MRAIITTTAIAALLLTGCVSLDTSEEDAAPAPTPTESPTEVEAASAADAPDTVGMALDEARELLAEYTIEEVDGSGENRVVFAPANWFVTGQGVDGDTVVLTLENERDAEEAERAAEREQAAAEEAAAVEAIGIDAFDAKWACQEVADDVFVYGGKLHTVIGVIAETPLIDDGQWFIKVEATVTNEYGVDMDAEVECYVSGGGGVAAVEDFIVY